MNTETGLLPEPRPLSRVRPGETVRLHRVHSGRMLQARLAAMGLVPGAVFKVMSNSSFGPFIVAVKESRVVLGRGLIDRIEVE